MMVRCSAVLLTCGAIKKLTYLAQSVLLIKSSLYFVVSWQFFQLIILFLLKAGKPTGPNGSRYLDPSDLILALCDLETFDLLISKLIVSSPCTVNHLWQVAAKSTRPFCRFRVEKIWRVYLQWRRQDVDPWRARTLAEITTFYINIINLKTELSRYTTTCG